MNSNTEENKETVSNKNKDNDSIAGHIEEFSKSLHTETESVQAEQLTISPGRLGTMNALRDEFSRLERVFVELKLFTEDKDGKSTDEFKCSFIQDKIKQFDSTIKMNAKTSDEKTLSQQQEIDALRAKITRLNEANNKLH